jgi:hypothetical protein
LTSYRSINALAESTIGLYKTEMVWPEGPWRDVDHLEAANLSFQITSVRPDALMVAVAVPGERWDIEFMNDGSVEVEVFRSDGNIEGSDEIERLFDLHG